MRTTRLPPKKVSTNVDSPAVRFSSSAILPFLFLFGLAVIQRQHHQGQDVKRRLIGLGVMTLVFVCLLAPQGKYLQQEATIVESMALKR